MVTLEAVLDRDGDPERCPRAVEEQLAEALRLRPRHGRDRAPPRRPTESSCPPRAERISSRTLARAGPPMPIKIPANLPAHDVLRREGVMVMSEETARARTSAPCRSAC